MTAELAREAFASKNYDLCVDIYERLIKENGPCSNLYLGLGDALSLAGQIRKAFESYSNACRLGPVRPAQLNHLVSVLVEATIEGGLMDGKVKEADDMFTCDICKALWTEPRTLHCGHTFCKRCLEKQPRKCYKCGERHVGRFQNIRTNVLLSSTVDKWFSRDLQAMKLKSEGNSHFARQNYPRALDLYTRALEYGRLIKWLICGPPCLFCQTMLFFTLCGYTTRKCLRVNHWNKLRKCNFTVNTRWSVFCHPPSGGCRDFISTQYYLVLHDDEFNGITIE